MTTKQMPEQIRASIHQDAINRVSEFFNATTGDIMKELLQNARRSGASSVDVTIEEDRITVSDNGMGIRDPEAILAFGLSDWDQRTNQSEHPAGMGLYALARREKVQVISSTGDGHAWRVNLTPDHFVGKLPAPIMKMSGRQAIRGTSVTFTGGTQDASTIRLALKHYPLPARINGEPAEQKDFLEAAVYIEEWNGVRIGVYRGNRPSVNGLFKDLNFHGIVVWEAKLPNVKGIRSYWDTQADVLDCPHLELTLPARREVVENPFMSEFRQACRIAIYRAMSLQEPPVDVSKRVQDAAAAVGVSLPDASNILDRWEAQTLRENLNGRKPVEILEHAIIMNAEISIQDQHTLDRAAKQAGISDMLFHPDDRLAGYDWYDRLTRANRVSITVTDEQGQQHDLEEIRSSEKPLENQRPKGITVNVETNAVDDSGCMVNLCMPVDVAFQNHDDHPFMDEIMPLVTPESEIRAHELVDMMMDAFFSPSEDYSDDSFETQEQNHEEAYEKTAIELLESKDEAIIASISNIVRRHIQHDVPLGITATIKVSRLGKTEITLDHH